MKPIVFMVMAVGMFACSSRALEVPEDVPPVVDPGYCEAHPGACSVLIPGFCTRHPSACVVVEPSDTPDAPTTDTPDMMGEDEVVEVDMSELPKDVLDAGANDLSPTDDDKDHDSKDKDNCHDKGTGKGKPKCNNGHHHVK